MISKFDLNIQSDELTAADLYEAQAEWEAEQYELERLERSAAFGFMAYDDPDYWG